MRIDEHADRDETRRCKLMIWFKEASNLHQKSNTREVPVLYE